jgi:hypothetical protein
MDMHFVRCAAAVAALCLATHVSAQPQDLLSLPRPLTAAEIDTVVGEVRQALAGKTLRLVQKGGETEVLVGQAGVPHRIRVTYTEGERIAAVVGGIPGTGTVRVFTPPEQKEQRRLVKLTEYTGVPAGRCEGAPATGEMVIDYLMNSSTHTWSVTARVKIPGDGVAARPLEMLRTAASLRSGERRLLGSRPVRAIVSMSPPWKAADITGDPAPNPADFVPVESLWIDTDTLLPVRWEITVRQAVVGEAEFVYERLDLRPPAGVKTPQCVP